LDAWALRMVVDDDIIPKRILLAVQAACNIAGASYWTLLTYIIELIIVVISCVIIAQT
jgi:hypothetical protein